MAQLSSACTVSAPNPVSPLQSTCGQVRANALLRLQYDPRPCPPCLSPSPHPLQVRADALLRRQYELIDCIGWLSDVGR